MTLEQKYLTAPELCEKLGISDGFLFQLLRITGEVDKKVIKACAPPYEHVSKHYYPESVIEVIKAHPSYITRRVYKRRTKAAIKADLQASFVSTSKSLEEAVSQIIQGYVTQQTEELNLKIRDLEEELARLKVEKMEPQKPLIDTDATDSQKTKIEGLLASICINSSYTRDSLLNELAKIFGEIKLETIGYLLAERVIKELEKTRSVYTQENIKY